MVSIIRFENSCQIIEEDDVDLYKQVDRLLSYKIQGAEYSKAYKGYTNAQGEEVSWDGHRHIMSSTGRFPPGLFERVKEFYNQHGIFPEVIDKRHVRELAQEISIISKLRELDKEPRPYQIDAVEKAVQTDRGIIRIATGGGKTLVAGLITAKLGKRTIIYVIGKDLLYQLQSFFSDIFGTEIGIIGDGKCEIRDINIATVWSVGKVLGIKKTKLLDDEGNTKEKDIDPSKFKYIKQMLLDAKVHILDECHLAACDTVQTIAKNIKAEYVYGMSASPWRDDGADLLIEAFLGRKIVDLSAKKLIEQGWLVPPDIRFLAPAPYPYKSGAYPKIYSKYIVENAQRNQMILKGATKLVEQGFPTLVLFHSIKHGESLKQLLSQNLSVGLLSGEDNQKQRDKIKDQLEEGKIQCIIASKIFDIGIDLPTLSGLIVSGGGKSSVRALQRIGRVIRKNPGKKKAAVLDFADQAPHLNDHAHTRKEIYSQEFDVKWPEEQKQPK
jgi:superfamily II DNA or RNA helicase